MLVKIPLAEDADASLVGGKAHSLDWLYKSGYRIPDTWVLTTAFFEDWVREVGESSSWNGLINGISGKASRDRSLIANQCRALADLIQSFGFSPKQTETLEQLKLNEVNRFAVRSSGVDEDLSGASFAGMYESFLNVSPERLAARVKDCFAAAFDARVFLYRLSMGFPMTISQMAVIVQRQIDSDVSGVVFSINPVNNDYDELVINAHPGLGEDLVSGLVTPDNWVIDKNTLGHIESRPSPSRQEAESNGCLSADQSEELSKTVLTIEQARGKPVDVEWAFVDETLYMLQVRPITNWVQLPPEMLTKPDEPRYLYLDPSLADGLTISHALTRATIDFNMKLGKAILGVEFESWIPEADPRKSFIFTNGLRLYVNLSMLLKFVPPKYFAEDRMMLDVTLAKAYASLDFSKYSGGKRTLRNIGAALKLLFRFMWQMRSFQLSLLKLMFAPERFNSAYEEEVEAFDRAIAAPDYSVPVSEFVDRYLSLFTQTFMAATIPNVIALFYFGLKPLNQIKARVPENLHDLVESVRGGGDNLVREMGAELASLTKHFPIGSFDDLEVTARQIQDRTMEPELLDAWDRFVAKFGSRGPLETELSVPKYGDGPEVLLQQLSGLSEVQLLDPREIYEERKREREKSYQLLQEELTGRDKKRLQRAYAALLKYDQTREVPKHHLTQITFLARQRALRLGRKLQEQGRLDQVDDVFQLTLEEMSEVESDESIDVRELIDEKCAYVREAASTVTHFPHLIDSRGRIVRAAPDSRDNVDDGLRGISVSRGVATGPALVMNDPFQKQLEPGDVLVAHTTDPGWTPLFINAAAIVLEIGGELQHGALVAREYGKPCVVGVVDATKRISDGDEIEVDANVGTITFRDTGAE